MTAGLHRTLLAIYILIAAGVLPPDIDTKNLSLVFGGRARSAEESPVDMVTQYQDGSFTYAMSTAHRTTTRVPLNLTRFAIPGFKTIEIGGDLAMLLPHTFSPQAIQEVAQVRRVPI